MRKGLILGVLVVALGFGLKAQSVIKITSDIELFFDNDNVRDSDTMRYEYDIVNQGNEALIAPYKYWNGAGYTTVGTFDHKVWVTSTAFPGLPSNYSFLFDEKDAISLQIIDKDTRQPLTSLMASDTATVYIEDIVYMADRHREGNNTIVVWPDNHTGLTIPDSLTYTIDVVAADAVLSNNEALGSKVKLYPVPTNNTLHIAGLDFFDNSLQELLVYNMNGQIVKALNVGYSAQDVADLAVGHYRLAFVLNSGDVFSKPFVISTK